MDALPLQEDFVSDFQSRRDGAMHACGHDTHVAMLASAAKLLSDNKSELTGKVRFMFQPGEEGYHGAKYMIEEGCSMASTGRSPFMPSRQCRADRS